jgi:hypothetical protein
VVKPDIEGALKVLRAVQVDDIAWMNPDDSGANEKGELLQRVLSDDIDLLKAIDNLRRYQEQLFSELSLVCDESRLAIRDQGGKWRLLPDLKCKSAFATAFAVLKAKAGSVRLAEVGAVREHKLELKGHLLGDAPEGSLIFLCRSGGADDSSMMQSE